VATEAGGIPLATLPAPANRRDDGPLAATLDTLAVVAGVPERPVVHLDAGYDYQTCRQVPGWPSLLGAAIPASSDLRHRLPPPRY
jgi:hypothetical protein